MNLWKEPLKEPFTESLKETFKEGNKTAKKFKIDAGRTISVAGGDFDVYATPDMIRDIERTCKEYILE